MDGRNVKMCRICYAELVKVEEEKRRIHDIKYKGN